MAHGIVHRPTGNALSDTVTPFTRIETFGAQTRLRGMGKVRARRIGDILSAVLVAAAGTIRTRDLVMDGTIGARFLNSWILILDLEHGRAWLAPAEDSPKP